MPAPALDAPRRLWSPQRAALADAGGTARPVSLANRNGVLEAPLGPFCGAEAPAPLLLEAPKSTSALQPPLFLASAPLSASIGPGGNNLASDIRRVQARLRELGYGVPVTGHYGPRTAEALDRFLSVAFGEIFPRGPMQPSDLAVAALFDAGAPRWVQLGSSGPGWKCQDYDGYDWAASVTVETLGRIGKRYARYQEDHPSAPSMAINDISRKDGSVRVRRGVDEHQTHRDGLDIDIRLPRRASSASRWGTSIDRADYDRDTTYAMLEAIADDPAVERILFADRELICRATTEGKRWAHKLAFDALHHDHLHVDVMPAFR